MPQKAKKTPDQKTALSSDQCGVRLAAVKWVADPKRCHETAAITIRRKSGSRLPIEHTLLSHLPESTQRILSTTMTVSQKAANAMKYSGFPFNLSAWRRKGISTEAAPK